MIKKMKKIENGGDGVCSLNSEEMEFGLSSL